jgi:S1-C subfamily serine protease
MTDAEFEQAKQIDGDADGLGNGPSPAGAPGMADETKSLRPVEPATTHERHMGQAAAQTGRPTLDAESAPPEHPPASYAFGALTGSPQLKEADDAADGGAPPNARTSRGTVPPSSPKAHRSHRLRNGALLAAAVVTLAAGLSHRRVDSNGGSSLSPSSTSMSSSSKFGSHSSGTSSSPQSSAAGSGSTHVSSVADKVDPGLVDIDTLLGFQGEEAAGTGIVVTSSGEVLTNNHVINGATAIRVRDIANGKAYSASVVGYDTANDVAVLQLHDASGLQTASIGNSSNVSVGETVVGIGNAGGTGGTPSAVGGTVTGLKQSITATDQGNGSSEQLTDLIETNADIQPGDSGGSLVTSSGQVIAIDTAGSAGVSFQPGGASVGSRGYAIPINEATSIAKEIESGTSSSTVHIGTTGFLGVEIESNAGVEFGSISGPTVAGVITSSPAQVAGLGIGDVIISVNGQTLAPSHSLNALLEPYHPGDKLTIGWTNSLGQTKTASVQLSSGPPQ